LREQHEEKERRHLGCDQRLEELAEPRAPHALTTKRADVAVKARERGRDRAHLPEARQSLGERHALGGLRDGPVEVAHRRDALEEVADQRGVLGRQIEQREPQG
jgi:hypothetical protein